jgi:hypothetical protein
MVESVSALMTGGRGPSVQPAAACIPCATLMQFFMTLPEVPEEERNHGKLLPPSSSIREGDFSCNSETIFELLPVR